MVSNDPSSLSTQNLTERGRMMERAPAVPERQEVRKSTEVIASASTAGALGGAGAAVLCIIALAGILPQYLMPIAAIVLGGAFILEGAGIGARVAKLVHQTYGSEYGKLSLGGGAGVEFIGGAAGVVLGILALVGFVPEVLMGCAVIALGATALLSVGTMTRLNHFTIRSSGAHPTAQEAAGYAVVATANAQALVGVGAIVLGILALIGLAPMVLNLVGLLALGGGLLLGGSAVAGKMFSNMPE